MGISNKDKREKKNKFQQLSGIMVVVALREIDAMIGARTHGVILDARRVNQKALILLVGPPGLEPGTNGL